MAKKTKKLKLPAGLKKKVGSTQAQDTVPSGQQFLLQEALALQQAGRLVQAEAIYRQVLALDPDQPEALNFLGTLAYQAGKNEIAEDLLRKALAVKPSYSDAWFNLALALQNQNRADEAIAAYQSLLALHPGHLEAQVNLGNTYFALNKLDEAVACFRKALALKPDFTVALNNLGFALQAQNKFAEAVNCYRKALALNPADAETHNNLGNVLKEQGKLEDAEASFRQALALNPDYPEVHCNLGNVLRDQGKLEDAVDSFRRALALNPDSPKLHCKLGNALRNQGKLEEAIDCHNRALALNPNYASAYNNLGVIFSEQGRLEEAIVCFRKAISLRPNDPADFHWNLSDALLLQGNLAEGFKEYRWRRQCKQFAIIDLPLPEWRGERRLESTLFVVQEQGYGDTIQFLRYLPMARELVGRIVFVGEKSLASILAMAPAIDLVIQKEDVAAHCKQTDVYTPLPSLPEIFGTTLKTIPATVPYLRVDPERVEAFRPLFEEYGEKYKVGIVWRGNPLNKNDRNRSCRPEEFFPLTELGEVSLFSLQVAEALPPSMASVNDLTPRIFSFIDTAAMMFHLDLVISVDTAVVHLAGALGRPVWTLLPTAPDWRWMFNREESPWYPTMRLFRQKNWGDWPELFLRVRSALAEAAGAGRQNE